MCNKGYKNTKIYKGLGSGSYIVVSIRMVTDRAKKYSQSMSCVTSINFWKFEQSFEIFMSF